MFTEDEQVHVLAGHFTEEVPFHVPVLAEIQETVMRSLTENVREIFPEHDRFLAPQRKTIGIISVSGKEGEIVECIVLPVCIHYLTEILAHYLIFVTFHHCWHFHSGRIYIRTEMLRPIFRKPVIEHVRFHSVTADEIEAQIEIIIEPVRRH